MEEGIQRRGRRGGGERKRNEGKGKRLCARNSEAERGMEEKKGKGG